MPIVPKHTLSPNVAYLATSPDGKRRIPFTLSPDDIRHFADTGREMIACGLPIRVPLDHQSWADPFSVDDDDDLRAKETLYNRGFVKDFVVDDDGELWSMLDIPDDDTANRLETEIRFVSPKIIDSFVDGTGREWNNCIGHVALTCSPAYHGQKPFGAKMKAPKLLSLVDVQGPLCLSLADAFRVTDGKVEALQLGWKIYENPKTGKKGAKFVGGKRIVYGDKAWEYINKQEDVKGPKKAKAAAPVVTKKAADKAVPAKAVKPQPYSRELSKLKSAAAKTVEKKLTGYGDVQLTDKSFANARRMYTSNRKRYGEKFLERVGQLADQDAKDLAAGKRTSKNGASLVSRMLAYRHMLSWHEQEPKPIPMPSAARRTLPSEIGLKPIEEPTAKPEKKYLYDDVVATPLSGRMAYIEERQSKGDKPFLEHVVDQLIATPGLIASELKSKHAAVMDRARDIDEENRTKIKTNPNYLPRQLKPEDLRELNEVRDAVKKGLQNEEYPPLEVDKMLHGLHDRGVGSLSYGELVNMAKQRKTKQLSLANVGSWLLSHAEGNMADDNDNLFDDAEIAGGEGDGMNAPTSATEALALLKDEFGLALPEDIASAEDPWKTLLVALKAAVHARSHDAGEETEGVDMYDGMGNPDEASPESATMLSLFNAVAKKKLAPEAAAKRIRERQAANAKQLSLLTDQVKKSEKRLADQAFEGLKARITRHVKAGTLPEGFARKMATTLESKLLSLASSPSPEALVVIGQLDMLDSQHPQEEGRGDSVLFKHQTANLSLAKPEGGGQWTDAWRADAKEVAELDKRVDDAMFRGAGVKTKSA